MLNELVNRSQALPADAKVLILGGGYSGRMLAALLRRLGNTVLCTRRDRSRADADLLFDSDRSLLPQTEALQGITHLLSTIPPSPDGQDPALRCLRSQLESMPLQWVGYLSTTGVYGDREGNWVSEANPAKPGQARSQRRLHCEEAWQDSGLPIQILRLPGIYGPGAIRAEHSAGGSGPADHQNRSGLLQGACRRHRWSLSAPNASLQGRLASRHRQCRRR